MSEVWLRVAIVGLAVLVVTAVVMWMRRPHGSFGEGPAGLEPGIYFFTSSTCADCIGAREKLLDALGEGGFVEIEWEVRPEVFSRVGIDIVPSTLVVAPDGTSTRHPGMPGDELTVLSP